MNILQLRDEINTLLSDLLGDYILPDGTQVPALYVTGQSGVPTEWKVEGIEATIGEFPELIPGSALGSMVKLQQLWEVILVQYSPEGDTLLEAMNRVIRRFPDATPRYFPGDEVMYERCRFIIPDMILRSVYRDL